MTYIISEEGKKKSYARKQKNIFIKGPLFNNP